MKKLILIFVIFFLLVIPFLLREAIVSAQNNNVGIGTLTPAASALLDIDASPANNKGVLIPRMTAIKRLAIPSPANSLLVFDTDSACFFYWNAISTSWKSLCNTGSGGVGLKGNTGATGATGNNGSNGNTGSSGATGNDGSNGNIGNTGSTGATGNNGTNGNTGTTGNNGINGNTGATGVTGNNGSNGNTGATGNDGSNGNTGATGNNGSNGNTGSTGITGNNGNTGATGSTGNISNTGSTGATGQIGATGAAGSATFTNGTSSKDTFDSSVTQTIAHGLGKTPTKVRISAAYSGTYSGTVVMSNAISVFDLSGSHGIFNCIFNGNGQDGSASIFSTDIVLMPQTGGNFQTGIITVDATNIYISWTKHNNPSGVFFLLWEAE